MHDRRTAEVQAAAEHLASCLVEARSEKEMVLWLTLLLMALEEAIGEIILEAFGHLIRLRLRYGNWYNLGKQLKNVRVATESNTV